MQKDDRIDRQGLSNDMANKRAFFDKMPRGTEIAKSNSYGMEQRGSPPSPHTFPNSLLFVTLLII